MRVEEYKEALNDLKLSSYSEIIWLIDYFELYKTTLN
jgi:hypothetical protein